MTSIRRVLEMVCLPPIGRAGLVASHPFPRWTTFLITLKAVRYHPEGGPSSTTVLHRTPLKITQTLVQHVGDRSGAVKYTFQAEEEGGEICAAVSFINVAKLSSFENEPFDCDPRPTSNQIWIDFWDVQLFSVKDGSGTLISRSDLFGNAVNFFVMIEAKQCM